MDQSDPCISTAQSGDAEINGHRLHTFYRSAEDILARIRTAGFELSFSELIASPANASVRTQDLVLIAKRASGLVQV
jgi:hypothetical protein